MVVTHDSQKIYVADHDKGNQSKVSDRFVSIPISLPDNTAFHLIGDAFHPIAIGNAKAKWDIQADDLNERLKESRKRVVEVAKISDESVMKNIMPIHPMTVLVLKEISRTFKSNQRSMFDFIKSNDIDSTEGFQWFITQTGPTHDHPLLTVDMLWNFFYDKGKEHLPPEVRLILDIFPQQRDLDGKEQRVLKTILIMQAIDQKLAGNIDLFKATDQNLSYCFEGISDLDGTAAGAIANNLKNKGILIKIPLDGNRFMYTVAVLSGDQKRIDENKNNVRKAGKTAKLVTEGGLSTVMSLPPALKLRFESEPGTGKLEVATKDTFQTVVERLKNATSIWKFHSLLLFAKDPAEATSLRKTLQATIQDEEYQDIVFIDALSTPLGEEAFEQYVEYSAMAEYYRSNHNSASLDNEGKAKCVISTDWKNRIYSGQLIVYTYGNQVGDKFVGGQGLQSILETIVSRKFPYVFDFTKRLTENQLKATQMKPSAKCGINEETKGVMGGAENLVLPTVWKQHEYWENPATSNLPISKIKLDIDAYIEDQFNASGQVSIGELYDILENKYGFSRCNLSAFLSGFLLKEYGREPYRYTDSRGGHEPMSSEKLSEMLSNYIGKDPEPTYILKMTAEEKGFYSLTEKGWSIPANSCASISQASAEIRKKMSTLKLPTWCLSEVDELGIYDVVQMYIDFVQAEGVTAHNKAIGIGKAFINRPSLGEDLLTLLTLDKCREGMHSYLQIFDNGAFGQLVQEIGAKDTMLDDVSQRFAVKHSCLWEKVVGEDEISKLQVEYGVIRESNFILGTSVSNFEHATQDWRVRLKQITLSWEALRDIHPALGILFNSLLKLYKEQDILTEQTKQLFVDLSSHRQIMKDILDKEDELFDNIYQAYLDGLNEIDRKQIQINLGHGLFANSKTECNKTVQQTAEEYRKNQLKTQLLTYWKDKTGTKTPIDWSTKYRTPILCMVSDSDFERAKKVFDTINRKSGTDEEVQSAMVYLQSNILFEELADEAKRDEGFSKHIVGGYHPFLFDLNKVRDRLLDLVSAEVYEWRGNPAVEKKVKQLADAEYNAGGSDLVVNKINKMDDKQLKEYMINLARNNINAGVEILLNGG